MTVPTESSHDPRPARVSPGPIAADAEETYLGLRAFEERHQDLFFGRDAEKAELLRVVRRAPLTVLFGSSGLGKTSLLQAGLFPALRDLDMVPVAIRLDHRGGAPELAAQVLTQTRNALRDARVEAEAAQRDETLWEYFHRVPFWNARNRLVTPALVIDQFEEIFTQGHDRRRVERFAEQLGDLIGNRIPESVRRRATAGDDLPHFVEAPAPASVILSLREDFLPALEELRREIPAIAENRYRLLPMTGEAAFESVVGPGRGLVTDEVARRIVRFVAAAGARSDAASAQADQDPEASQLAHLHVEPALLSLVCAELDERRRERGLQAITAHLVQGASDQILSDFYARSVADVPRALRVLIEERLIDRSGFRSSEPLGNVLGEPGVTPESVDRLIDRRVLRQEDRFGTRHVELIHDRLTVVVREARDRRRAAELRWRRRWQLVAFYLVLALFSALGVLGFRGLQSRGVRRQLKEATALVDKSRAGDLLKAQKRLDLALETYRERLAIAQRLVELDPSSTTWRRSVVLAHQAIGEVLEAQGDLLTARDAYQAALGMSGGDADAIASLQASLARVSAAQWLESTAKASVPAQLTAVPGGNFLMGCNKKVDQHCNQQDKPLRTVHVDRFSIDMTEVTVAEFAACVAARGCSAEGSTTPFWNDEMELDNGEDCNWAKAGREQHPMNCVNWKQARAYCEWAGKRLPTEKEWEKAARGTDGRKYPWGNNGYEPRGPLVANIADQSMKRKHPDWSFANDAAQNDDQYAETAPVGSFPAGASPYGALDMVGNVSEWVTDKYGFGFAVRGGSYGSAPNHARTSYREWNEDRVRLETLGFRCAW